MSRNEAVSVLDLVERELIENDEVSRGTAERFLALMNPEEQLFTMGWALGFAGRYNKEASCPRTTESVPIT